MLLAFDIGNTNVMMGLYHEGAWKATWRARTVPDKMPDEYAVLVSSYLRTTDVGWKAITGVIISSVVPRLTGVFTQLVQRYIGIEPLIVSSAINTGVKINIDHPPQAGADRIVNAAAVIALYGPPAIVIDFGTATNFDVISSKGCLEGVAIAPGIQLAHDALVSRAARLHKVDLTPPPDPIGKNTIHAMQSGLFWGYVGLVEGLVARLKESLGEDDVKVLATGGLAPLFSQHTQVIDRILPELTLDGLRVIYALNQTS